MNTKSKLQTKVPQKQDKISTELLTLTYGAIVAQIVKDTENVKEANEQLEKLGHNIGQRLIDEFFAKSDGRVCRGYREMADTIATVAFDMFLGVKCSIEDFEEPDLGKMRGVHFNIVFTENPLTDFVELPEKLQNLDYCNIICGVLRGALEKLLLKGKVQYISDTLKNEPRSVIRVEMVREIIKDDDA